MNDPFLNAYELLEVRTSATPNEIKQAYKKKAIEFHPDKHNNSSAATAMFKLVTRAKEVLLDPIKRREHDIRIGLRKRPAPEPEVIFVDRPYHETDWGTIIGAGLTGLIVGAAFGNKRKKKKK